MLKIMNANIEHESTTQTAVTTPRMSGEDRRHEIHKAAFHLFAKNGFRGTTTKEIASAAGVSEASLFQYFKAKAELYAAVLETELNNLAVGDWLDEIDRCAERRDDEKLFNLVAANILEKSRSNPDFLRLMLYSALEGHESAKLLYEHHSNRLCKILVNYISAVRQKKFFSRAMPQLPRKYLSARRFTWR